MSSCKDPIRIDESSTTKLSTPDIGACAFSKGHLPWDIPPTCICSSNDLCEVSISCKFGWSLARSRAGNAGWKSNMNLGKISWISHLLPLVAGGGGGGRGGRGRRRQKQASTSIPCGKLQDRLVLQSLKWGRIFTFVQSVPNRKSWISMFIRRSPEWDLWFISTPFGLLFSRSFLKRLLPIVR